MKRSDTTLRELLNALGFDWNTGRIVYHDVTQPDGEYTGNPGWSDATSAQEIPDTHPILDKEFYTGFGGPQCPRFVAEDAVKIYFPSQYDGSTQVHSIWKDLGKYLDFKENSTPYPGG